MGAGHLFGPQIWILKDLGPMSFWSHGHLLWRGVDKIKVVVYVTNSYLVGLDTPYPDPWGPGAKRRAWWGSWASVVHFGENFIKQKLLGTPNLVGRGHLFRPQIWKDLGPVCFWSRGLSLSRGVYKIKVVVYVVNRYPLNRAWPQGQGIVWATCLSYKTELTFKYCF